MGENAFMRPATALAVLLGSCLFHQRPAIAQAYSGFEHTRVSLTSVHHYVASDAVPRQLTAPPNLVVSSMYRPLVESMLRDSPTFRRQCIRIASEPKLTVHLVIGRTPSRSDIRATMRLTRTEMGRLSAAVDIGSRLQIEELIAHEFEHIIEQLDGVDLPARAALPHTGVTLTGDAGNMFETTRAKRMGLKVVSELGR